MSMREQLDILTAGQGPKVWRCTTVACKCGIHYHFVVQLPLPNLAMPGTSSDVLISEMS